MAQQPETPEIPEWPMLFKPTKGAKKIQMWHVSVQALPDGTATITTVHGQTDGEKITDIELVDKGKRPGTKAATTPLQQAIADANSAHTKKKDRKHYSTDPTGAEGGAKRALAPMLAHKYMEWDKKAEEWRHSTHVKKVDWANAYGQPKLDGHRLTYVDGRLWSREGVDNTEALPHIARAIRGVLSGLSADDRARFARLDGELYQHGLTVTKIGGYVKGMKPERLQLQYHVYDVPSDLAFIERWESLRSVFFRGSLAIDDLSLVPTVRVRSESELFAMAARFRKQKYEGGMLRWGLNGYEAGDRSDRLLKVKHFEDAEFEVVGFKEGKNTYAGAAIFECLTEDGNSFNVTAPGTIEEKRKFFRTGPAWVGKLLTVRYSGWTTNKEGKSVPFHPGALRFHDPI